MICLSKSIIGESFVRGGDTYYFLTLAPSGTRRLTAKCLIYMSNLKVAPLSLEIEGARENNLKSINLSLPHDRLTVITGLSGSGKSSLAFETIHAEGTRRYIETFTPYTRQFFDRAKKPDLDLIRNVRPSIAIQQKVKILSSRSTVGSMTNINDLLKVLWANCSRPFSPASGEELQRWSPESVEELLGGWAASIPKETTFYIVSEIQLPSEKKRRKQELTRLEILGFSRVFLSESNSIAPLEEGLASDSKDQRILVVIDRVKTSRFRPERVRDSVTQAFDLSRENCVIILPVPEGLPPLVGKVSHTSFRFSSHFTSESEKVDLPQVRPALFDPNSAVGACPTCRGFGRVLEIDPEKVIPDTTKSLRDGAVHPWESSSHRRLRSKLLSFAEEAGIDTEAPWNTLSEKDRELLLSGKKRGFKGVVPWFKGLERKAYKMHVRVFLARYRSQFLCPDCSGSRLRAESLYFRINDLTLPDFWALPIERALPFAEGLLKTLASSEPRSRELEEVAHQLFTRLQSLDDLGLPYLTLERLSRTLSGGETQRVNLATALGSELVSTQFVLDEPSVGLHPRDTERLLRSIRKLTARGNSVLVVEHDLDCIEAADDVIELGPEAGSAGGEIQYHGSLQGWRGIPNRGEHLPPRTLPKTFSKTLKIKNADQRNLKAIDVDIPIGFFTALAGPSGSGKSSLLSEVVLEQFEEQKRTGKARKTGNNRVEGFEHFQQVLMVDQSGLAKSPRANIATYAGLWDYIRAGLADTEAAEKRSLTKSSFSFNVEGGRCPSCKGAGYIREDMQFLSDVYVRCDECLGQRFQSVVLEVVFQERNASDWLNTTVSECAELFRETEKVRKVVHTLERLGLGHLRLGHSLKDLSGGEAQRLKLVPFINQSSQGSSLLLFDEPTTGLHLDDVKNLCLLLRELTLYGHTVVCIEHNQELLLASDWIIDLGPEGGEKGGELVASGTPQSFITDEKVLKRSLTALYLKEYELECSSGGKAKQKRIRSDRVEARKGADPLRIAGARENNLKNISLELPHDQIIAVTGVSGSGKSSIAKDIIYAEGQRRYLDCLSPYARQFIRELSRPEVDEIHNVRPPICVYQHTFQPGRRSTLGTMSEVYTFLRLLFSKLGTQHCPEHPEHRVEALTAAQITERIKEFRGEEVRLLAPVIHSRKGMHKAVFQRALKSDISEVRVDGAFSPPSHHLEGLERNKVHTIEYVWAQVVPNRVPEELITEAIQQVFAQSGGTLIVHHEGKDTVFSGERACPICQRGFFKLDPEDLSFHSTRGRCQKCDGTGELQNETCPECEGARIKPLGRAVFIADQSIADLHQLTAEELQVFMEEISWPEGKESMALPVMRELKARLETLIELGLDAVPLSRSCHQLSNGELQRLRLSAALGTPLSGALYIFDEPSAGLHPWDNDRVIDRLKRLKEARNSVIMIEHEQRSIDEADHILELGPDAGRIGGEIVYNGPAKDYKSKTELGLFEEKIEREPVGSIRVTGATCHNLHSQGAIFELNQVNVVAGVSGAGKSSLVHGVLLELLLEGKLPASTRSRAGLGELHSDIPIDRILVVDQSPIGKNSRSTPVSYLKIWDQIRKLFASTIEARSLGWGPGFFSYNSGDGRCPECKGLGRNKLEMSFLAEAYVECPRCRGARYTDEALSIRYLGKNIHEVLQMTFEEAKELFAQHKKVHRVVRNACELGLGYLQLGQNSTTLSGGESQRIKLVSELSAAQRGHSLYVLDEPTVGLHRRDVAMLLKVLHSLVSLGNTIVVIEHDQDIIQLADHLIELGPGAGEEGGEIIFSGSPSELAGRDTPWARVLGVNSRKQTRRKR